jgi:hypothetical protein
MSSELYYYADENNQVVGPLRLEEIHRFAEAGVVPPDVMICEAGGEHWRSLGAVSGSHGHKNGVHLDGFTDYNQVPWHRKSDVNSIFILAAFLTGGLFPGLLFVCIVVLTGDVYYKKSDDRGFLLKWHWMNKVIAVVLLIGNIFVLSRFFL